MSWGPGSWEDGGPQLALMEGELSMEDAGMLLTGGGNTMGKGLEKRWGEQALGDDLPPGWSHGGKDGSVGCKDQGPRCKGKQVVTEDLKP